MKRIVLKELSYSAVLALWEKSDDSGICDYSSTGSELHPEGSAIILKFGRKRPISFADKSGSPTIAEVGLIEELGVYYGLYFCIEKIQEIFPEFCKEKTMQKINEALFNWFGPNITMIQLSKEITRLEKNLSFPLTEKQSKILLYGFDSGIHCFDIFLSDCLLKMISGPVKYAAKQLFQESKQTCINFYKVNSNGKPKA